MARAAVVGGVAAALAGCSLTANTSTSAKSTLPPVTRPLASTTLFRTVPFSPTTSTTIPGGGGGAAPVVPSGELAPDGTYEVKSGDTLSGIAKKLGIPYADLVAANPQIDPNKFLLLGQKLTIPTDITPVAPSPSTGTSTAPDASTASTIASSGQTYTVVANDTFIGIAKKLGVPLDSLLSVNNMNTGSLITPGMKLKVPVGGKVPKATTSTTKKP